MNTMKLEKTSLSAVGMHIAGSKFGYKEKVGWRSILRQLPLSLFREADSRSC